MNRPLLLEFLANIYPSQDYCVLCLRTSNERRLEKPNKLKLLLKSIHRFSYPYNEKDVMVCNICERQADSAHKFLINASTVTQAHIIAEERSHVKRKQVIETLLEGTPEAIEKRPRGKFILELEMKLQVMRARTQLLHTEVLVVSTPAMEGLPQPGESRDLYVIPDDVPINTEGLSHSIKQESEPELEPEPESELEMESIIIDEEDAPIATDPLESTPNIYPRLAPELIKKPTKAISYDGKHMQQRQSTALPRLPPEPIKKPITAISYDGKHMQQSTALQNNYLLHPIQIRSGMMTVPSLSAQIIDGRLITSKDKNIQIETPRLALQNGSNLDFISDPSKVANVLKILSHQDVSKVHVYTLPEDNIEIDTANKSVQTISNTNTNKKSVYVNLGTNKSNSLIETNPSVETRSVGNTRTVGKTRTGSESLFVPETLPAGETLFIGGTPTVDKICSVAIKSTGCERCEGRESCMGCESGSGCETGSAPQLRSDRIDWEDKIPMDVISTMDADVNNPKRARKSTVDSVIDRISRVTRSKKHDFIDLC